MTGPRVSTRRRPGPRRIFSDPKRSKKTGPSSNQTTPFFSTATPCCGGRSSGTARPDVAKIRPIAAQANTAQAQLDSRRWPGLYRYTGKGLATAPVSQLPDARVRRRSLLISEIWLYEPLSRGQPPFVVVDPRPAKRGKTQDQWGESTGATGVCPGLCPPIARRSRFGQRHRTPWAHSMLLPPGSRPVMEVRALLLVKGRQARRERRRDCFGWKGGGGRTSRSGQLIV